MLQGIRLVNKKADEFDDKIYNLKNKCDDHSLIFSYIDNLLSDYQYQYCDNIMDDMNRDDLRGYNSTTEFVKELDNDLAHIDNVIANSYLLFVNVVKVQDELNEADYFMVKDGVIKLMDKTQAENMINKNMTTVFGAFCKMADAKLNSDRHKKPYWL